MNSISDYKSRVGNINIRDSIIQNTSTVIRNNIINSPAYFEVNINNSSELFSAQIVDDSDTKDQKVIVVIDYILKNGDIIDWQSEKWINIVTDNMGDIYYRGVLRRCNGSLKWIDEEGDINERYFTFKSDPATNFGIDNRNMISLGDERRTLLISCDDDTRLFERDQRFIFDSRAWKITAIDNISIKNVSIVSLEEDLIDAAKDNLELEIADYYDNVSDYKITIVNGESAAISEIQTLQLNVTVTNNNTLVTSPSLEFLVSDTDVLDIDEIGLITPLKTGSAQVTVKYKNVSTSIDISVTESITNSYTCEIVGPEEMKVSRTQAYSVKFYHNGTEYSDESTFTLTGDDGISTTKLASISVQDGTTNTCTVLAGSTISYVQLHVSGFNEGTTTSKRIRIKPLY